MNVIRAKVLGFCMGVRRAVQLAYTEAENSAGKVYTLGPLIHNPQVLEDLKSRGVEILDENHLPRNLNGASVVIRAHGISPQTEDELRKCGAVLIDATCPRVKASQLKARALAEAGHLLFLAGEKSHAEIAGILGYAKASPFCAVVGNAAEASAVAERLAAELSGGSSPSRETGEPLNKSEESAVPADFQSDAFAPYGAHMRLSSTGLIPIGLNQCFPSGKLALIGQTTISEEEYLDIAGAIAGFFPDLEIASTICAATRERQDSLRELLDKVDAVVIVGGRESANTRRLFTIAEAAGKPCVLAETARNIPGEFFRVGTLGITAGASTPDTVIDEIERVF